MSRWPILALSFGAIALFNPWGFAVFHAAFLSSEALSRRIWQPVYVAGISLILLLAIAEYLVRLWLRRRNSTSELPVKHTGADHPWVQ